MMAANVGKRLPEGSRENLKSASFAVTPTNRINPVLL